MKKKIKREELLRLLLQMAFGKTNDAVKLAFIDPENEWGLLDKLDLTPVAEVKRAASGAVELKLINRLEAAKLLLGELEKTESEESGAARLFSAIDRAAEKRDGAGEDG